MITLDDIFNTEYFDWFMTADSPLPEISNIEEVMLQAVMNPDEYDYTDTDVLNRAIFFGFDKADLIIMHDNMIINRDK